MSKVRLLIGRCVSLAMLCSLVACGSFAPSTIRGASQTSSTEAPAVATIPATIEIAAAAPLHTAAPSPAQEVAPPEAKSEAQLIHALAERFKKPEALIQRVVTVVNKFASNAYPARDTILAIIAVESSFNPHASHKGSQGLMQINVAAHRKSLRGKSPFDIETNVSLGVSILSGYYEQLGNNERSSLLAYNAGIGNFLKRHYKIEYYVKYRRELAFIRSILR